MTRGTERACSPGVTIRPPELLLASRARDFLTAGPADAVSLIAHVCQLPNPPRFVAEEMALALFAGRDEFERQSDGRWRLSPPAGLATPTPVAAPPEVTPAPGSALLSGGAGHSGNPAEPLGAMNFVVVDVETTGGRPYAGDRITEVAAVVVRDGVVREVYETLVNPERPIPPLITALTNITWAMVRDKPTFREICPQLVGVLAGRVFVAHNATFDWRFLCAEVRRATGERLEGRRLCTVRLARRLLPHLRRRSLDSVAHYYGIEIAGRHRAGGDARATANVLLGLLRDAADRGVRCWPDLEMLLVASRGVRRRRGRATPHSVDRDTTA